jgi:DNA processing protein
MSGHAPGLSRDEGLARIRLIRSPNIGPVTFAQLLRRFGNARAAIDALPDLAARGAGKGRSAYRAIEHGVIEAEIAAVRAAARAISFTIARLSRAVATGGFRAALADCAGAG